MFNIVKKNSKSGLKIKQILSVVFILIFLSTNLQLFISTKEEKIISKNEMQNEVQENIKIAENEEQEEVKIAQNTYTRKVTLARSSVQRGQEPIKEVIEKQEEEKYKSIEEIEISKTMDLTVRCGISKEDFRTLMQNLKKDTSGFFEKNSDTIYDLCEKYELNEIFFCGLIAAESGWNISSGHRKKCNYISMMSKGKLIKYASEEEGLEAAAKLLHTKYLTPGGSYYRGKTLSSVQKIFCPNSSTWVNLVYGCMKQVLD